MIHIYDSSAVIALLKNETGSGEAQRLLDEAEFNLIHAINLCEVEYHFARVNQLESADASIEVLMRNGLRVRPDLNPAFRRSVARLKVDIPAASLGDCFALALAQRVGGAVVTADRPGFLPARELAVCEVVLIR